ncbi:hypothetical protein SAMN05444274_103139 [Mariniphaga anaerophila]|uniref:Uncharacterized protein n=1 Tax=Mariniphaga anaerophila TaxID=1484053 RepID=A0A1M4XVT2_9BACT|nr:hypothetical protein SAMN05444274_103139 [Mariniphaga anaerophila]
MSRILATKNLCNVSGGVALFLGVAIFIKREIVKS